MPSLDTFLERHAWQNQQRHHLGVTYIAVDDASRRVVGYFTAAMAAIALYWYVRPPSLIQPAEWLPSGS